ncbi:MAG: hypothetical protein ACRC06_00385 [Waterburya sp.]
MFTARVNHLKTNTNNYSNYSTENQLSTAQWLADKSSECQKINVAYQEIYSFETENDYINVCQLDNNFYYHRQAKFDDDVLLIPAEAIFGGSIFQASNGSTTYFVGKDGDRLYSSVMNNDHEIVFEPELPLPASSLSRGKLTKY